MEGYWYHSISHIKSKASPYSLPSVGPGAYPGVQAVSPQVTISHPPGGRLPLLSARPAVTFPAAEHHRPLARTKLYCLVTKAHRCEQLAQGCYAALPRVSHTRTVVRECCKDDDQCQWERPKFDPPQLLNPLTDHHQNLFTWLRRGYLPSCKISSRSDKEFRFCACAISRIKLFNRLFVRFFGYFKSSTTKTPARILTQNTSKDAVPRKDVPFGGRKTKS